MLELPGGLKVVGIVGPLPLVEIDDPPHAELVAVGVGDDRIRGERQPVRVEDQMFGYTPGRFEVFVQ